MSSHPLNIPKSEWNRLKHQVGGNNEETIKALQQSDYVEGLNQASYNMTKDWENSYEKIIQRQEEERINKKKAEDESRMSFYRQLLERKKEERENMLAEARDTFFKQKDEPKTLESALMCSEALREQESQRRFNERLRKEEKEREVQEAREIERNIENYMQLERLKHQKRWEKNVKEYNIIKDQIEEKKLNEIKRQNHQISTEIEDVENAKKEMEKLQKYAIEIKLREKEALWKQGNDAIEMRRKKLREDKIVEEMEDKLIDIYEKTNCKIKNITEQVKKNMEEKKSKIRNALRDNFPNKEKIRLEMEEANCKRAIEEYQKRDDAIINQKLIKKNAIKEDRLRCYQEYLQKQKETQKAEENLRAWEIANRFENTENTKHFNEMMKQKEIQNKAEYRAFILKQWRDLDAEKARQKKETYDFYHTSRLADMKAADNKFLTYADNLIKDCIAHDRPIHPLEKVIKDYKGRYMNPPKRVQKHLKTHIKSITEDNKEITTCQQNYCENINEEQEVEACPPRNGL